jgi:osmoprotectant transport system ATP-binding protein
MCIHMISLKNVSKSFDKGQHLAVKDISLHIREGETLVLLGSSGCGKTTLLKLINRLLDPTSGTIEMDGKDITGLDPIALRRSIGYVFQGIGLFPHMSVEQNVGMVPRLMGVARAGGARSGRLRHAIPRGLVRRTAAARGGRPGPGRRSGLPADG